MERFSRGEVRVFPFPFSDSTETKVRPALIIATFAPEKLICCPITSQFVRDPNAVLLTDEDFIEGGLNKVSTVRPGYLFTADESRVIERKGRISEVRLGVVREILFDLLGRESEQTTE